MTGKKRKHRASADRKKATLRQRQACGWKSTRGRGQREEVRKEAGRKRQGEDLSEQRKPKVGALGARRRCRAPRNVLFGSPPLRVVFRL